MARIRAKLGVEGLSGGYDVIYQDKVTGITVTVTMDAANDKAAQRAADKILMRLRCLRVDKKAD